MTQLNLKQVLMELGNRLVTDYGYMPGRDRTTARCTGTIIDFTEWLNNAPEAREILADMDIAWPVVRTSR